MKIQRFFAPDIRQAMRLVREQQGPDAVILSNNRVNGGVEIVSAIDFDESMLPPMTDTATVTAADGQSETVTATTAATENIQPAQTPPPVSATVAAGHQPATPVQPAPTENVWSQEPTLVEMRSDLKSLRHMLENQLSSLAWGDMVRSDPQRVELMQRLLQFGLSAAQCKAVADIVNNESRKGVDIEQAWRAALDVITRGIQTCRKDILESGGIVALVGATGVGKTTTVAKLAARYAMRHGSRSVGLVTIDNYRVGAYEQLKTYGRLLDIPVKIAESKAELHAILEDLSDRRLILIDTMGMGQRDSGLEDQAGILDKCDLNKQVYLLLSAAASSAGLDDVVSAFGVFQPDGCIVTKIDESTSLGGTLSVAVKHQLPIAYTSDGQRVPEDLHAANAASMVAIANRLMEQRGSDINEELATLSFGREITNAHV